ncbi:type I polyketide synthase [Micromonospora sp. CA-263727]|uniref:type I polyketide synthase n=1 Tax=Micromonospora sp. CA-263727 TaxID=3239967 RepID=UPI003D89FD95
MSLPADEQRIAIVGMAGRFPGAGDDLDRFWANVVAGVSGVSYFNRDSLTGWGVPAQLVDHPRFVPARAVLPYDDCFDGDLFGYTPAESALLDPQQRLLLESAYAALEHSGYPPVAADGNRIGVFVGTGQNTYLLDNLLSRPATERAADAFQLAIASEKDFAATRIAYKLNLQGPALAIQTACSTSLVAVHTAVTSLLTYESDMALAGAASVASPSRRGYLFEPGGILSSDGRCRVFDAGAEGTVPGDGVAVVVLKRLSDALLDRDTIHAVILGSAVNNDGARKAGYTAPGSNGQALAISSALRVAGVSPRTIGVVETHGTGTRLGDPIELAGLRRAFGDRPGVRRCALTALKSTVGHLDTASGIAGLIATVLALRNRTIPPVAHYRTPNEQLELADSGFSVDAVARDWEPIDGVRRAGVSSFGIGGTNAHVVLEEAPPAPQEPPARVPHLVMVSARTEEGVQTAVENLARHLAGPSGTSPADVAFTQRVGRQTHPWRAAVLVDEERRVAPVDPVHRMVESPTTTATGPVFVFPGQAAHQPGMGHPLYVADPAYRQTVDDGAEHLLPLLGRDLRPVMYEASGTEEQAFLAETWLAQPALYLSQVALARSLASRGVTPVAVLGHGVGEYAAACVAGAFSFEAGLEAVARRGLLMSRAPVGATLAVHASVAEVGELLPDGVAVAEVNSPRMTVVSGRPDRVADCEAGLAAAGLTTRRLPGTRAFDSSDLEAAATEFMSFARELPISHPRLPFCSAMIGRLLTDELVDPEYWVNQMFGSVNFTAAVATVRDAVAPPAWLEVGPSSVLRGALRDQLSEPDQHRVFSTGVRANQTPDGYRALLTAVGELWQLGVGSDWASSHDEGARRVPIPGYPFVRIRHWITAPTEPHSNADSVHPPTGPQNSAISPPDLAQPATEGPTERVLADLWTEVLGVERAEPDEDLFELGGHSLTALRLSSRIRERLGVEVHLDDFFDNPTFGALSRFVSAGRRTTQVGGKPAGIPRAARPVADALVGPATVAGGPATDRPQASPGPDAMPTASVFFFSASEGQDAASDYQLVLDAARLADRLGFEAIWTPERHFHRFGALYPNPAVLGAALAASTERIHIRAGSVVLPLHHPLRLVEDWSIVDVMSGGRTGISFAPGFHPLDFVLAPERFEDRRQHFARDVDLVRRLWRGESMEDVPAGGGARVSVVAYPSRVQPELPLWITAGESDASFRLAGQLGANLLTALLVLTPEQLQKKIAIYRAARAESGHDPAAGRVTLMVHAYVGQAGENVEETCREAFSGYLRSHTQLLSSLARATDQADSDLERASEHDREAIVRRSYRSFLTNRSLLGTPEVVREKLLRFGRMDVDEVAGLVDFGLPAADVLDGIARWNEVRTASGPAGAEQPLTARTAGGR